MPKARHREQPGDRSRDPLQPTPGRPPPAPQGSARRRRALPPAATAPERHPASPGGAKADPRRAGIRIAGDWPQSPGDTLPRPRCHARRHPPCSQDRRARGRRPDACPDTAQPAAGPGRTPSARSCPLPPTSSGATVSPWAGDCELPAGGRARRRLVSARRHGGGMASRKGQEKPTGEQKAGMALH